MDEKSKDIKRSDPPARPAAAPPVVADPPEPVVTDQDRLAAARVHSSYFGRRINGKDFRATEAGCVAVAKKFDIITLHKFFDGVSNQAIEDIFREHENAK